MVRVSPSMDSSAGVWARAPLARVHVWTRLVLDARAPPVARQTSTAVDVDAGGTPAHPVVLNLVRDIEACSLGHRGVLLDFGDLHEGQHAPGLHRPR